MSKVVKNFIEALIYWLDRVIDWDKALELDLKLLPDNFNFESTPPAIKDEKGHYEIAVPGKTKYMS